MKTCTRCKVEKPVTEYHKFAKTSDGLQVYCKACMVERRDIWRAEHPDKEREHQRRARLKKRYGMTVEEFDQLLDKQGGVCKICKRPPGQRALSVDHCHDTGKIRGILCHQCNVGLGLFKNDPGLLVAAAGYLKTSEGGVRAGAC